MPRVKLSFDKALEEILFFQDLARQSSKAVAEFSDVKIGVTPREAIAVMDGVTLFKYKMSEEFSKSVPILVVYALVNRPEMIDLQIGRSFVESLTAKGFDVYLIDWGDASTAEANPGLDDYILGYIDYFVDFLRSYLERTSISLLGVCQGGTFSICYSSLFPEKIDRLITTVTPVDFLTQDDILSHMLQHINVEKLVEVHGNIAGNFLNTMFLSLKPYKLTQQKYVRFVENIRDIAAVQTFFRMEKWIFGSPSQPGTVFAEFMINFYHENKLVEGGLLIGDREVNTQNLSMPILNILAASDHIVPPTSSQALGRIVPNSEYTECRIPGGHVGIFVAPSPGSKLAAVISDWITSLE